MSKSSRRTLSISALLALVAVSPVLFPNFYWHILMVMDAIHPFMYHNTIVNAYHTFLLSTLPERPEMAIPEISRETLTLETLREATQGYTKPVLIRGAISDIPAVKYWNNAQWWVDNYGDERVMGNTRESPACYVRDCFGPLEKNKTRMYIEGESSIFVRYPELQQMLNSSLVDSVIPGKRVFTQMFGGYPGMGSDVHAAMGVNVFHMIAGRKKWWLFPQTQTPYLFGSVNPWDKFSAWTKTRVGKHAEVPSPWITKMERYVAVLEPGDLLFSTSWTWHGVLNVGENPDEVVIGIPMRFTPLEYSVPAFKNDWVLSLVALAEVQRRYGSMVNFMMGGNGEFLQEAIGRARDIRKDEELKKFALTVPQKSVKLF